MGLMSTSPQVCFKAHCWEWGRKYLKYCLCDTRDGASLALGLVSVISWGVAEIPQILTNYRDKSAEGLSLAFLFTWIVGDLFNFFGCLLEPATLPTQFYMAILFTLTTVLLTGQSVYYGYIYPRLKSSRQSVKYAQAAEDENRKPFVLKKHDHSPNTYINRTNAIAGVAASSPIPLPAFPRNPSLERELYYTSARFLSRSHTPTIGAFLAQRRSSSLYQPNNSVEEPLLGGDALPHSAPSSNVKPLLCAFSVVTFVLGTFNLRLRNSELGGVYTGANRGVVLRVGRKILQVSSGLKQENGGLETNGIGTFLGWGMAFIYMGGRLPQICLNIRRGHVEGLNPLMFVFALVGNITYVGSILVDSLEWSKIKANLPWLVDAGGCVILDTFILIQFMYYRCRTRRDAEDKHQNFNH